VGSMLMERKKIAVFVVGRVGCGVIRIVMKFKVELAAKAAVTCQ
jgi:hypothetical protein